MLGLEREPPSASGVLFCVAKLARQSPPFRRILALTATHGPSLRGQRDQGSPLASWSANRTAPHELAGARRQEAIKPASSRVHGRSRSFNNGDSGLTQLKPLIYRAQCVILCFLGFRLTRAAGNRTHALARHTLWTSFCPGHSLTLR